MTAPAAPARAYPVKRLGEVAEFLDGMRRDLAAAQRHPGPYPYYGANGLQGSIDRYLFDEPLVLLAEDLSGFAASGKPLAQPISGKTWVSKRIHVLRTGAQIEPEFLCRALEKFDVASFASGAKGDRLTRDRAADIGVPLPPLAEQRKIAALLERADDLRQRRRQAGPQLDAFVRIFFLERFGDPVTNPRRWPCLAFGSLGENQDAQRSRLVRAGALATAPGAYPCYDACGVLDWTHEARFDGERLLIAATGTNLVTRQGPVARVVRGRFAVSEHAHVAAANARADLHYLKYAIELTELKPYLSSGRRPNLRRASLDRIPVPVPPLELQHEFRRLVERVEALGSAQRASAQRLDELYASLRAAALRGELQFS